MFLIKTDRYNASVGVTIEQRVHNKMTECSFNALAFFLYIPLKKATGTYLRKEEKSRFIYFEIYVYFQYQLSTQQD